MANTPTKYSLIKGTYEQLGYQFMLEKDPLSGDTWGYNWEVSQPKVAGSYHEMAKGRARTKTRAMKASVVAVQMLDDS